MNHLKMALKDNDYVIRAKTVLGVNGDQDAFSRFFKEINDELITGQTAHLEIDSTETGLVTFEISRTE